MGDPQPTPAPVPTSIPQNQQQPPPSPGAPKNTDPQPSGTPVPVPAPTAIPQKEIPPDPLPAAPKKDTDPYDKTPQNTSPGWLPPEWANTNPDLVIHLDGMTDYAKKMKTISDTVGNKLGHFSDMTDLSGKAWTPNVIPEGAKYFKLANHNFAEIMQYMYNVKTGVENIAMAAQAVVDYYGDTDGWSAADLAAVDFAFGDHDRATPANWAHGDKTWLDYQKDAGNTSGQLSSPSIWTDDPPAVSKDGKTVTYHSKNQRGETRTVTITTTDTGTIMVIDGPEGKTTTVTAKQPDGKILKTSSMESKPDPEGKVTKFSSHQTVETGTKNGVTTTITTSYNGDNKMTGQVIDVIHKDGTGQVTGEEITTISYSVKDGTVSDKETLYLGKHADAGNPGDVQKDAYEAIDRNNYRTPVPNSPYAGYTPIG